ncbi:MAG: pilus assembly PilX N-terminal domain-containing protein [Nitrospira sp.]|nr:pilus assembly PilX N-terminal domain-containing protein [Nitrospira sp.]
MSNVNVQDGQQGIALLGAMVVALILSMLGATLLNLAGQEAASAGLASQAAVAQQLADGAGELVVAWFHSPRTVAGVPQLSSFQEKRNRDKDGAPSFFDALGRSQFVGTVDQPDLRLQTGNPSDHRLLNDPETGMFHTMTHLGQVEELKIYAPSKPGLLCTIDTTVVTNTNPPVRQSILMQLGALDLPPLRAAVQVGRHLGRFQSGNESPVFVHWGELKVGGDLILTQADEIPLRSALAQVTGQAYDEMTQREDRWMEGWIGGTVQVTQSPVGETPSFPGNLHMGQNPIPGVSLDQWPYENIKRMAKRFGRYFAIDREGLLYPQGIVEPGRGISPDEVFRSQKSGDQHGLIFIDTLDQTAPRPDNLGVVRLQAPYFEGMAVVQGHVVLAPTGSGQSIGVLSPPQTDQDKGVARIPVQLSGMHFNGVLHASGDITIIGRARLYGAVAAGGTITSAGSGNRLEVWYDHDLSRGLYRGLPVVYRAPGTWMTRY